MYFLYKIWIIDYQKILNKRFSDTYLIKVYFIYQIHIDEFFLIRLIYFLILSNEIYEKSVKMKSKL